MNAQEQPVLDGFVGPVVADLRPALRRINLEERTLGGSGSESRYFASDCRVTRERFDAIKRAAVRLECLSNSQVGGCWRFYSVAVVPRDFVPPS